MKKIILITSLGVAVCASASAVGKESLLNDKLLQEFRTAISVSESNAQNKSAQIVRQNDFEQWKKTVYKEPFENGGYIVSGDIHIPDDARLLEFYLKGLVPQSGEDVKFLVARYQGYDDIWNSSQKKFISYCVSNSFGTDHTRIVRAMEEASSVWEQSADIEFVHNVAEDDNCNQNNQRVIFDVRPVDVNGQYLARAFFPSYPRASQNVLIDKSALNYANEGPGLTLTGILRHELGHVIGARHEHTRPEAGACFEDKNWRPVTNYDPFSVMHYPQCNGLGDWTLTLTHSDKNGSACTYGAAPGFQIDHRICRRPS
eukprot:TRINITY_DN3674_c0_g1_i1.p1 TRINITY_DN3674_c0_g1~~TRINITY_DN3674_c0_g1_i1.p1  ORF type:complete len:315 (-),score=-20.95 TRINITY_DN3674_c0_g1_i1:131-1075(-)